MKVLKERKCLIMVAQENGRWHLSISRKDRYPNWDEIKRARYDHMPKDILVAMLLPPENEYVNLYSNCFHLWEITPDEPQKGQ